MIKLRRTETKSSGLVKVANAIMIPNIWLQADPVNGVERKFLKFTYGQKGCTAVVFGRLYERDFGPFMCMLRMARQNRYKPIESHEILLDIAREMGYTRNPWQKAPDLWDTFDRLLDVQIRIRPEVGRGLTAKFSLIEGWLDSEGGHGSFSVSEYRDIVLPLLMGETWVNENVYSQISRGQGRSNWLAASFYRFITRQRKIYMKREVYEIRLSLLCKYLNYDIADKPWSEVWKTIRRAAQKSVKERVIGKIERDTCRYKRDGGVVLIHPAKANRKKLDVTKSGSPEPNSNTPAINKIRQAATIEFYEAPLIQGTEANFSRALDELKEVMKDEYGCSLDDFLKYYMKWLVEDKRIKYISTGLFNTETGFCAEYIAQERRNDNMNNKKEREHMKWQRNEDQRKRAEGYEREIRDLI